MTANSLGRSCHITTGKLDSNAAVPKGKYPFFTCSEFPERIDTFAFDGDVVLVAGNNAKGNFHVSKFKGKFNAYQRTYVISALEGVSIDYVYYALKLELKRLREKSQGSQTKFLTKGILEDIVLGDLSYRDQQSISSVLSRIDEKIELNNKINSELESMAKLIYDYWFVQFDFPDENGKPYKSSGGKMVYNKDLKREIPVGWCKAKLEDVIARISTGLNPRNNFCLGEGENYYITIKSIEDGKIVFDDRCDRVSDKSLEIINKRSDLKVGDVLFTSIQPVGVTYLVQEKPTNWNINESVFTIRANPEKVTSEFLYVMLSGEEIKLFTRQSSSGSIHKGIRHNVLKDFNLPYGGKDITKLFSQAVRPMLFKFFLLDKENQQLARLRDWLLPMLMNGQVKIK